MTLAILNGKAALVAVEQQMEDTSCQVECPTVPKSCIVVNSTKKIPERKVPKRDGRFVTSVPGIYLIGDVSGVPLIKNAINEGGAVIDYVVEDIKQWAGTAMPITTWRSSASAPPGCRRRRSPPSAG